MQIRCKKQPSFAQSKGEENRHSLCWLANERLMSVSQEKLVPVGYWGAYVRRPMSSSCQLAQEIPTSWHMCRQVGIMLASTASPSFWSWISTFWGPALLFIAARVGHWTMRSQKCKCKMVRQITFNTGQFLSRQTQNVWLEAFEYLIFKYLGRGCCTDWEHLNIHCRPDWRHWYSNQMSLSWLTHCNDCWSWQRE
mgnify:CR=1 FL=1